MNEKRTRESKLTGKFILAIAAIYSLLILGTSFSFSFFLKKNYLILKDSLMENNRSIFIDKASIIIERIRSAGAGNLQTMRQIIEKYCTEGNDILYVIIYSKTSDENYFKVLDAIQINSSLRIGPPRDTIVKEEKETHYLKKALINEIVEQEIYSQGHLYWQNVYHPYSLGNAKLVIQFLISSSYTCETLELYSASINKIRLFLLALTAILIMAVIAATAIFSQNFSLLIRNLTRYMNEAAGGNTGLNLRVSGDQELNELALSFNSLMEEIKDIKNRDIREQNLYRDLFNTGVSLLKESRNNEAIALFKTLIIMNMGGYGCYFNLGVAYARIKEFRSSLEMFEKAHEANPEFELTGKYIEKIKKHLSADESA